jgi:hypothetical protein
LHVKVRFEEATKICREETTYLLPFIKSDCFGERRLNTSDPIASEDPRDSIYQIVVYGADEANYWM